MLGLASLSLDEFFIIALSALTEAIYTLEDSTSVSYFSILSMNLIISLKNHLLNYYRDKIL